MERGDVGRRELLHWTTNDLLTDASESLPGQVDCGTSLSAIMLSAFFKHVIHTLVLGGWFDFISKAHVSILNGREAPNHI